MAHPGVSINFDGQDLQEEQEEELEFEDRHREQELHDLLSKALPDDLLEDDVQSISTSRESSSPSSCSSRQDSPVVEDQHQWLYKPDAFHQVSTPYIPGQPPPLETPAGIAYNYGQAPNGHLVSDQHDDHSNNDIPFEHEGNGLRVPESNADASDYEVSPTTAAWNAARQLTTVIGNQNNYALNRNGTGHNDYNGAEETEGVRRDGYEDPRAVHYGMYGGSDSDEDDHHHGDDGEEYGHGIPQPLVGYSKERRHSQHYEPAKSLKPRAIGNTRVDVHGLSRPATHITENRPAYHSSSLPGVGKVQYQGRRDDDIHRVMSDGGNMGIQTDGMIQRDPGMDPLQQEFTQAGTGGRDVIQLEILYRARGRELEELAAQLRTLQEDGEREKRILNHQLAMAQDERDGLTTTYEESQRLMNQVHSENQTLQGQLQVAQNQIETLKAAKEQVLSELGTANATIESLSHQLAEMQRAQPLHRAREQQESLLAGLQQKYSQEVNDFRQKLDAASKQAQERGDQVEQLEAKLAAALRGADQARLEHAEVVNRLTASLQDSQTRCQQLILQGSLPMVQDLQMKLQQASTSKEMADNLCQSLQEELSELKDQLKIYEAAADLGVVSIPATDNHSPDPPGDADIVRNFAKEDWKTPMPPRKSRSEPISPEETLQKLKEELSRSLQSLRTKREQVTKLQAELRQAKDECEVLKHKTEEAEAKCTQAETKLQSLSTAKVSQLSSTSPPPAEHTNDGRGEMDQEGKSLLDAKVEECKKLEEQVCSLKTKMAQMVTDSDQDKKDAVDRCQKTCLQLHEDSSRHLREQLVSELQAEKDTLNEAHQYQLQQLRDEMAQLEKELLETKELYIAICEEKKTLEEDTESRISATIQESIAQIQTDMEKDKSTALQELKTSLETSHRAELLLIKEKYKKDMDAEIDRIKADQNDQQEKLQADLRALQQKYTDLESSISSQISNAVEKAKGDWQKQEKQRRMSLDRIMSSTLDQVKADHEVAIAEWQTKYATQEKQMTDKVANAVREAKEAWQKDEERRRASLTRAETSMKTEMSQLQQKLQKTQESQTVMQRENKHIKAKYAQLKGRHEEEVTRLREELVTCQAKLQQTEKTLQEELEQLQTEMREANSVTMESMQERVSAIQQKHQMVVEQMQAEWEEERRGSRTQAKETVSVATQTTADDHDKDVIDELRKHYLKSVENVRASAMNYVTDMQKRCQETLRTAVFEERQRVATKMRKFYTKQVQSMREKHKERERLRSEQDADTPSPVGLESTSQPVKEPASIPHSSRTEASQPTATNVKNMSSGKSGNVGHIDETPRTSHKRHDDFHPSHSLRTAQQNEPPTFHSGESQVHKHRSKSESSTHGALLQIVHNNVPLASDLRSSDFHRTVIGSSHPSGGSQMREGVGYWKQWVVEPSRGEGSDEISRQSSLPVRQDGVQPLRLGEMDGQPGHRQWDTPAHAEFLPLSPRSASTASGGTSIPTQNVTHRSPAHRPQHINVTRRQEYQMDQSKPVPGEKSPNTRAPNQNTVSYRHHTDTRSISSNTWPTQLPNDRQHTSFQMRNPLSDTSRPNLNLSGVSQASEYTELPQSLPRTTAAVNMALDHQFVREDFSRGVALPKQVMELRQSRPVRDGNPIQDPASLNSKLSSLVSKTMHEDSGINSPAYTQQ